MFLFIVQIFISTFTISLYVELKATSGIIYKIKHTEHYDISMMMQRVEYNWVVIYYLLYDATNQFYLRHPHTISHSIFLFVFQDVTRKRLISSWESV